MAEQKVAAYVSVHAFSQLWMFPYGHIKSNSKHYSDLKRVAQASVSKLRQVKFRKIRKHYFMDDLNFTALSKKAAKFKL